jgi:hypothetical protein
MTQKYNNYFRTQKLFHFKRKSNTNTFYGVAVFENFRQNVSEY